MGRGRVHDREFGAALWLASALALAGCGAGGAGADAPAPPTDESTLPARTGTAAVGDVVANRAGSGGGALPTGGDAPGDVSLSMPTAVGPTASDAGPGAPSSDASTAATDGGTQKKPADASEEPIAPPEPPPIVNLSSSWTHSCVVLTGGRVKCWGGEEAGQLGLGDGEAHGDEPGEMGSALPAVDLGSDVRARAVAAGKWASCVLTDDARIKCWGSNVSGPIGRNGDVGTNPDELGDALPFIPLPPGDPPRSVVVSDGLGCAVLRSGTLTCWSTGEPSAVDFGAGRRVRDISLESSHGCVLFESGHVQCFGLNSYGQLGLGDTENRELGGGPELEVDLGTGVRAVAVTVGDLHSCALLEQGDVKCWGFNRYGQLGLGDTEDRGDQPGELGDALPTVALGSGRKAVAVDAGGYTTCALLDDASLKCWGGERFQYGLGTPPYGDDPGEMGDSLPAIDLGAGRRVTTVRVAGGFTCVILDQTDIKCFGLGEIGVLGLGNEQDMGDVPWEMGDALPVVDVGGTLLTD